jgi:hypothetical protein
MRGTCTIYGEEKCIQDSVKKYERPPGILWRKWEDIFYFNILLFYCNIII